MFIFYDTETTGLDAEFGQILQIALVFTDDEMNILSSKKLECRRSPWVVPSPAAMLITGFSPDDLKFSRLSHYEMMREVDKWVRARHWPVTVMGYNTVGFDEKILAQNLYQNLLEPDLTTASNGGRANTRADVMIAARATALYVPGALKLDILNDYGSPSMSLMHVAQQNGVVLSSEDAHDAMNDIIATIGVAKVIMKTAPQLWEQIMSLATVDGVNDFMSKNEIFTYAATKDRGAVVAPVVEKDGDANVQVVFDLSFDPTPYLAMNEQELVNVYFTKGQKVKPFMMVDKTEQPIFMPMDQSEAVLPKDYDEALYASRAKMVADPAFREKLANVAVRVQKKKPVDLPEQQINKAIDPEVQERLDSWMADFWAADDWQAAGKVLADFTTRFKDDLEADPAISRFAKFATRIVYEHAPEELSEEKQDAMKHYIAARVLNPDLNAPYNTIAKARKDLAEIEKERAEGKKKWAEITDSQIRSLKLYYTAIEKENLPYGPPPVANNDNDSPVPVPKQKPQEPKI